LILQIFVAKAVHIIFAHSRPPEADSEAFASSRNILFGLSAKETAQMLCPAFFV
jgi:hypothetical protein